MLTANISSSSDSDILQRSSACPIDHQVVDLALFCSTGWSTRWGCGFHGVGKVSIQCLDRMSCRIQEASLHCCSCCHILPLPWLYRDLCCHFPLLHSSRPLLSSSHGVQPCSLPHCRWSLHTTGWWWYWCASPWFWSLSARCWSTSVQLGTYLFLSSGWRRRPRGFGRSPYHCITPSLLGWLHTCMILSILLSLTDLYD